MKKKRSSCPLVHGLDLFGDKWTLLILRDIVFSQKNQYRQFMKSPEKIASNILVDRLKRLIEQSILIKKENPKDKKVYDFYLTKKGIDLIPIVVEIIDWGLKYDISSSIPTAIKVKFKQDRYLFVDELVQNLNQNGHG